MNVSIEVKDLYYHYPDGTEALARPSFRIETGECVALIGPNGAGKSTLMLHLNGILPDDAHANGEVRIDGEIVGPKTIREIRRKVGLLFQDPDDQLFCSTVFEDVAFGPRQFGVTGEALKTLVADSLDKVGLRGFENRAPHRLSGGEKRRVCLAGLLACEPSVLVLDEPTSNLDPRGRRELIALLQRLPATKLIATHDLEMAIALCPRSLVLDGGLLVADGPTREILSDEQFMLEHGLERPLSLSQPAAQDCANIWEMGRLLARNNASRML